nr:hypothetical protein CFP56_64292 [Quercus suber]
MVDENTMLVNLKKKEAQRMAKPLLECERGYREASVDMCEYLSEGESLQVSRWPWLVLNKQLKKPLQIR